jgi:uncharacterized pyridoxamine 5'-phosphate oxidase family protein
MYETEQDIEALQALLNRSYAGAGAHLQSIVTPDKRLTAQQVVNYLTGVKHIAVATVSSRNEPRVSPVDGHFLRGKFYFGTEASSLRIRHLRLNPAISVSHFEGDAIAITVHGRAVLLEKGEPEADWLAQIYTQAYGSNPYEWGNEIVFGRVEPELMFTFALEPEKFAGPLDPK